MFRILSCVITNFALVAYVFSLRGQSEELVFRTILVLLYVISKKYILTAAHCIITENNTFLELQPLVIPGIINAYARNNERLEVEVAKAYVPKEFKWIENGNTTTRSGDIAVLKLTKKLQLDASLTKLNLPWTRDHRRLVRRNKKSRWVTMQSYFDYAGAVGLVAGYGAQDAWYCSDTQTEWDQFFNSTGQLYKIHVTILSNLEASSISYCLPKQEYICAIPHPSYKDAGLCNGDSGSPLVLNNTVIGVFINGPDDCRNYDNYPGQFTRTSYYIDFLKNAMRDKVTSSMRVHFW